MSSAHATSVSREQETRVSRDGFDIVLGNPPWEMPEVDDREFFTGACSKIANEPSAQKRRSTIRELAKSDPPLHELWQEHLRTHEGERLFFSNSGRYPNAGSGRLNYYKIFLESGWQVTGRQGRLGMVIPSGLTTNAYERPLWHSFVKHGHVAAVLDFENKRGIFPTVDSRAKFSLLTVTGAASSTFSTACWLHDVSELHDTGRVVDLSIDALHAFSPNELALPQFRSQRDLHLLRQATEKYGGLADHADWQYTPRLMFSSSDAVFTPIAHDDVDGIPITHRNRKLLSNDTVLIPVYEGKMVGVLDHRQADILINPNNPSRKAQERPVPVIEKVNPTRFARPQHWIPERVVRDRRFSPTQGEWELIFCDVTSATNERTTLSCIIPLSGLTRNLPAIYLSSASAKHAILLTSLLSSFVLDYFARLKVSSNHLTQGILATLPIPPRYSVASFATTLHDPWWFTRRALPLNYTAWDIEPAAAELGYDGPPFVWDEERRFQIRCELDAAFFHLYGVERDDVDYIMETFPIVKRKDIARTTDANDRNACYITKDTILAIYDEMAQVMQANAAAEAAGQQPTARYRTRLDPPPGPPTEADGNFIPMAKWDGANWPQHIHHPPQASCVPPNSHHTPSTARG